MATTRRKRREYTEEFKKQMVQLFNNGKSKSELVKEYDLTPSVFERWIKQYNSTKSFKKADSLTEEQKLILSQEKELKQLRMENDIVERLFKTTL